jgi:UDP-N-acetylmuramyl pentapeptide phosphotransferase/UDP-N-acetylglucosamine-1-phosphate transferase
LLVSFVSLIDDVREVSIKVRLLSQIIAISLIFFQFNLHTSSTLLVMIVVACIMTISLNAYNFLDGINGMTSAYSLIQLACLYYINQFKVHFIDEHLLIIIALAVIVFTYFNFRVKAICFAGDVGSISIALIVCSCIFKLIMLTHNFIFINLLLVYYLDAVSTFIFRWLQGQDVFKAHKKHFYLFLVNDLKWPHLTVASLYATVQLVINLIVINAFDIKGTSSNYYHLQYAGLFIGVTALVVAIMRIKLEGRQIYMKKHVAPVVSDQKDKRNFNVIK